MQPGNSNSDRDELLLFRLFVSTTGERWQPQGNEMGSAYGHYGAMDLMKKG
jgi:hypothetical protein